MFEKVIENWTSRLDYIRASRGSPMPEIIFKMKNPCALPLRSSSVEWNGPPRFVAVAAGFRRTGAGTTWVAESVPCAAKK
ncbi:hypothetical protein TNCV_4420911 [Trichonephila clavipes]|nr:hypothetical protein TNCV_4420911 [Trichonephila clavipes]